MEVISEYCTKCVESFDLEPDKAYFDESGYGYSTKLVKCPNCNTAIVVGYYKHFGFNVNNDPDWY